MSNIMKPIFIGHGSPMNAISANAYTDFLKEYARSIPLPEAVVVISAHWQAYGTYITGNENPEQIYDFYGFPEELYQVKYSPPGSGAIAQYIKDGNLGIDIEYSRGIDHAAWAVLKHMYPARNIPQLELSLDINKTPEQHFELGRRLYEYCDRNILFVGSGNMVHNLYDIKFEEDPIPFQWAVESDNWLKNQLENKNIVSMVNYEKYFPGYEKAMPTSEHYLPLLYILGMLREGGKIKTIYEEIQNGSISMRSIEAD